MNVATSFLNSKGRRIYQGAKGGYFSKKADGKRVYGVKAAKRVAVGSSSEPRKIVNSLRKEVPSPIRPAVRKPRANKGVARGPREGTLQRRMNVEAVRRAASRMVARKPRANKGVARGPREGTLQRRMNAEAVRRAAAKARMARRKQAAVNVKMMANKNPYSALARKPAVRKPRVNKGVVRGPRKAPVSKKEVAARVSAINELINAIKTANKMLNSSPKPRMNAKPKVRVSPNVKNMVRRRRVAKK